MDSKRYIIVYYVDDLITIPCKGKWLKPFNTLQTIQPTVKTVG